MQDVQRRFALRDVKGLVNGEGEERRQYLAGINAETGGVDEEAKGAKGKGKGYKKFGEAAKDLETLVDVVWVSGTCAFIWPPSRITNC